MKEARLHDGRPDTSAPLASLFPGFIASTSIPKELPRNVDNKMSDVFRYKGMSATDVYTKVHDALKGIMTLQPEERANKRFDDDLMTRLLVVTSVPLLVASQNKQRDHWPYAGAALLESLILPDYRPILLEGPVGHLRNAVRGIMLKNVAAKLSRRPSGRWTESKQYEFPDGLETPRKLPPLAPLLSGDIEQEYRDRMARLDLRHDCESVTKYIAGLKASQVILKDSDGNEKVYLCREVADALEEVHRVRPFSFTAQVVY